MIAILLAMSIHLSQQSPQPEYATTCHLAGQEYRGALVCIYRCYCGTEVQHRTVVQSIGSTCQASIPGECM